MIRARLCSRASLVTESTRSRHGALVALILLTLIWSYNWTVMKQVLRYIGPFDFSALRYVLGTAVLFVALIARQESLRPPPLLPTALIGLAQTTGFQALVQWALVNGGAGKTALLAYTMPFWVVVLAWALFSERPTASIAAALGVAACGLALVLEPWHGVGGAASSTLAIAGGICWALGVVLSKHMFRRGVGALSLTAWQMLIGSLFLVVIAAVTHEKPIEWSTYLFGALAYNAILSSGLGWLMWSYVVARLPSHVAGLASLATPIAGIGFAWVLLRERPSMFEGAGIVLIGVALAIVTLRKTPAAAVR